MVNSIATNEIMAFFENCKDAAEFTRQTQTKRLSLACIRDLMSRKRLVRTFCSYRKTQPDREEISA